MLAEEPGQPAGPPEAASGNTAGPGLSAAQVHSDLSVPAGGASLTPVHREGRGCERSCSTGQGTGKASSESWYARTKFHDNGHNENTSDLREWSSKPVLSKKGSYNTRYSLLYLCKTETPHNDNTVLFMETTGTPSRRRGGRGDG